MNASPASPHNQPPHAELTELFALEPETVRCPYRMFADYREAAPVVWVPEIESYMITRYEDIMTVLRQPEVFSSAMVVGPLQVRQTLKAVQYLLEANPEFAETLARAQHGTTTALLTADPPLHKRQRSLISGGFSPRHIRQAEPRVYAIANQLIDAFIDAGEVEFVGEFAVPLPLTVIAEQLGVSIERMADFKRWSDAITNSVGNHLLTPPELARQMEAMSEFFEYFAEQIADRRARPTEDMLSSICNATLEDGDELGVPEMLAMLWQLLGAGNDTTASFLASAMACLAERPELLARLQADPNLVEPFVEEMLRIEPPVQGLFRLPTKDVVVGGVAIPAGKPLWLVYASGNRDECVFTGGDDLVLDRENPRSHLSFGFGEHYCLGSALARMECRIALTLLLERVDNLSLAAGSKLLFEANYVLHGLKELRLTFTPRIAGAESESA